MNPHTQDAGCTGVPIGGTLVTLLVLTAFNIACAHPPAPPAQTSKPHAAPNTTPSNTAAPPAIPAPPATASAAPTHHQAPMAPPGEHLPPAAPGSQSKKSHRSIQQTMARHMPAFRRCYENALKNDPSSPMPRDLSFTIGADGKVSAVNMTFKDAPAPSLECCIERVLTAIEFAPHPQGHTITVSYPFNVDPAL